MKPLRGGVWTRRCLETEVFNRMSSRGCEELTKLVPLTFQGGEGNVISIASDTDSLGSRHG